MATLIDILREARQLLAREGNDFSWSSWEDAEAALAEIDGYIAVLEKGQPAVGLAVVFAPTGRMQEVSLSSGWGQEFIDLAARFDAVHGE